MYNVNMSDLLKFSAHAASVLVVSATSAFGDVAEPPAPFPPFQAPDEIREITTEHDEIMAACPQLTTVALITEDFDKIEIPEEAKSLYFSGEILSESETSPERLEEIDQFRFSFLQASEADTFFVHVNSSGGSVDLTYPLVNDMFDSRATIVTHASDIAASAAFDILMSGTNGYRSTASDTYLMVHPFGAWNEDGTRIEAEDFPIGSDERAELDAENEYTEGLLVYNSVTQMTDFCADHFVQPDTEVQILPEDALKLGLIDGVINWSDRTITMRADQVSPYAP